ncbi:MAG: 16S rRNA processing protein RimM [Alphaproteobacteria bacterium]|nr:16S rRNA processing protein RimM [Alphaproteobacteria bacterium]
MSRRLCVGVVVGAHGLRGELRVKSFTGRPIAVAAYGPVEDEGGALRFRLKVVGEAKGGVVLARAEGVADRDAAEALTGTRLWVPRAALPAGGDDDDFYVEDLIGLAVEDEAGEGIGTIASIGDFGAGDVVEVRMVAGGSALYAFTRANFPVVDPGGGRVVLRPPHEVAARPEKEGTGSGE